MSRSSITRPGEESRGRSKFEPSSLLPAHFRETSWTEIPARQRHQPSFGDTPDLRSYQQSYATPLNMAEVASSLPNAQQILGQSSGLSYQTRLDAPTLIYYPNYASSTQTGHGYVPHPGYGQHQMQWMPGQHFPLPTQLSPSHPDGPIYQGQVQTSSVYQYGPYGVPQQFVSPASVGRNIGWFQTSGSRPELSLQTIPRGPPPKPRQSGHALWVGNLPQGAAVIDLKDHFSQGAKKTIESVKLISKSNCAFVNYRTHDACTAAMERFHDSKFNGTRLVCRLRRTLPLSPTVPSEGEPSSTPVTAGSEEPRPESEAENIIFPSVNATTVADPLSRRGLKQRFFVMKSLTLHDLEISTRTGVWATQAHNEAVLNAAYEVSDRTNVFPLFTEYLANHLCNSHELKASESVCLFFSANKSGEYFGYGRMASAIPAQFEQATSNQHYGSNEPHVDASRQTLNTRPTLPSHEVLPKAIITPETEFAPRGRIIDDMARGTMFWEADEPGDESPVASAQTLPREVDELSRETISSETRASGIGGADEAKSDENFEIGSLNSEIEKPETIERTWKTPRGPVIATSTPPTSGRPLELHRFGEPYERSVAPVSPLPSSNAMPASTPQHGNAFRVEWLVVKKLPFYKCRGLRNPWNANREVKIARDGTEIETSVGQRLLSLFGSS